MTVYVKPPGARVWHIASDVRVERPGPWFGRRAVCGVEYDDGDPATDYRTREPVGICKACERGSRDR